MSEYLNLDREREAQGKLTRRAIFLFLLVGLFGIITLFQIVKLTVLDSSLYTTISDENRIVRVPIYPSRGLIRLSNGEIVTENTVSQALTISSSKIKDIDQTLEELKKTFIINERQLLTFKEKSIIKKSKYERLVIAQNLSQEQIARFSVQSDRWPGLSIEARLMRFNLFGPIFSHILGYVGQISLKEIEDSANFSYPSYPSHIDHIAINEKITNNLYITYSTQTLLIENILSGGFSEYDSYVSDHRPVLINLDIPISD